MEGGFLFVEEKRMKPMKKSGGNESVKKGMHFKRTFFRKTAK